MQQLPAFKQPAPIALSSDFLFPPAPPDEARQQFRRIAASCGQKAHCPAGCDGWAAVLALAAAETHAILAPHGRTLNWLDIKDKFGSLSVSVMASGDCSADFDNDQPSRQAWTAAHLLASCSGWRCQNCGFPAKADFSSGWGSCFCHRCCQNGRQKPETVAGASSFFAALAFADIFLNRCAAEHGGRGSGIPCIGDQPDGIWPDEKTALDSAANFAGQFACLAEADLGGGMTALSWRFTPALTAEMCRRLGIDAARFVAEARSDGDIRWAGEMENLILKRCSEPAALPRPLKSI